MVNQQIKIAICGKQNVGKNTVANLLVDKLDYPPYEYDIVAFADPIKEMVCLMFPQADRNYLFGPSHLRSGQIPNALDKDNKPLTYRQVLIDLGGLGRSYDKNIWVKKFDNTIKNTSIETKLIICPDLRHLNEYQYLRDNGFYIIKIVRNLISQSKDSTETEQDGIKPEQFDYILENNSTMNDLGQHIEKITKLLIPQ